MLRIAQIGCGYWGPNLLRNLVSNPECDVCLVAEQSDKRQDFVKGLYPGISVTKDVNDVFEDSSIDAVVIATPAGTHFGLSLAALESGKHILVEKPMATSVDEVQRIGELAAARQLVAMVGHTFIYNSAVRFLKEYVGSGALGDLRYIYSQRLNLGRIRSDVDALWNLAPHDVSIVQYLLDDQAPLSVKKLGMDYVQPGIDDVVYMDITYPGKVMAHVHVSWLDPHKTRKMTVVGSRKMVVYDDVADQKIAIYDKGIDQIAVVGENMDYDNPTALLFEHRSGDVVLPKIRFEEPLRVEIAHFVECVQGQAECLTGPAHAMNVVRILAE